MPIMPNSFQQLNKLTPSNDMLRIALLKWVNGSILHKGCNHLGKVSTGKNVPASKNCGKVNRLANGGIVLSFLAKLLTINPNPINNMRATKLNTIISRKVTKPCTNVK